MWVGRGLGWRAGGCGSRMAGGRDAQLRVAEAERLRAYDGEQCVSDIVREIVREMFEIKERRRREEDLEMMETGRRKREKRGYKR